MLFRSSNATNGESSAHERLAAFREEYPGLEARISQRAIASYLGITPQYMSRLRREAEAEAEAAGTELVRG